LAARRSRRTDRLGDARRRTEAARWQRRDDWRSHPQLAHRLESNRFITDLIAATLPDPTVGVSAWYSSRDAEELLRTDRLRPDAGFTLDTPAGAVQCWLEWDRGTETQERLEMKLRAYRSTERRIGDDEPRSIVFVVPGRRRLEGLRAAYRRIREQDEERIGRDRWATRFEHRWPIVATTALELHRHGALAAVWQRIDREREPTLSLLMLPSRRDLQPPEPQLALGRRWRHDQPAFWERLSPLGTPRSVRGDHEASAASTIAQAQHAADTNPPWHTEDAEPCRGALEHGFNWLAEQRRQLEEEMRRDIAATQGRRHAGSRQALRLSGVDGLMPDPEDEERPWL
jgi:hypothetical protein